MRGSFSEVLLESLADRRLFIKLGTTNGRLGIDSLSAYAMAVNSAAVLDGAVFAFCTKMRKQVRLLLWDHGGYWLLTRKVYRGTFVWPESSSDQEYIEGCYRQLRVLLQDTRSRKQAVFQVCEELEKPV